jgi:hypothetical protein
MMPAFGHFGLHTRGGRIIGHREHAQTNAPRRMSGFGQASSAPNAQCSILNLTIGDGFANPCETTDGTQECPNSPYVGQDRSAYNANVQALQTALTQAGFANPLSASGEATPADGYFGTDTANALAQFQSSKGLPQSGVVDAPTAALLMPGTCVSGASSGGSNAFLWILGALGVGAVVMSRNKKGKK